MSELKNRLLQFLKRKLYWDATLDAPSTNTSHQLTLQKFLLFLVYNTNTDANELVDGGESVCHLVGKFPRMAKCVLFYLIRELQLFRQFCVFLEYGPTEFVVQFLDWEFLSTLKDMDSFKRLEFIAPLIVAIYRHCWLARFVSNGPNTSHEDHFEKINDFTATLLLTHVHVQREKFPELKTQLELDSYLGHLLMHLMRATIDCLELYQQQNLVTEEEEDAFQNSMQAIEDWEAREELFSLFQLNSDRTLQQETGPDKFLSDFLATLTSQILNRMKLVAMEVSCSTFMNWMEHEMSKTVTLQRAVGELAYELNNSLARTGIKNDIDLVLKEITVKPLNVQEVAKAANISEIIDHIEDWQSKDRHTWMREFLSRGE